MSDEPRRRWFRLTIRGIMLLVVLSAVGLYLGIAALDVYWAKETHVHCAVDVSGAAPGMAIMGGMEPPFWPRYVRRVFGRPWKGLALCGSTPGFEAEQCELEYPQMAVKIGNQKAYHCGPVQTDRIEEILKQRGK